MNLLDKLKTMTIKQLCELFELTTNYRDPHIPTVRGWLMDEIERRNPEGFDAWLCGDAEDSTLKNYVC